jgi:molybdate transport system ATP-binding protein
MLEARVIHTQARFTLDVDVQSRGPVLGLFGASGCGKTTLLHCLAGLIKPREARIAVNTRVVCSRPGGTWVAPERRKIALVTQEPLLFPHLSVRSNLGYAPGAAAELESDTGWRIVDVLRLRPLLERRTAGLSGGEKQRVVIARALLSQPELLLLDEPTSALDAHLSRDILALLAQLQAEFKTPMVYVTHKAPELLGLADDCAVLEGGKVIAQGPPLEVLKRPRAIGVANLAGVDNLLKLPLARHDDAGGVSLLELGGGLLLAVPRTDAAPGATVHVGIYADEIMLCLERPAGISARNALPATVQALTPAGVEVLAELRSGETDLRVNLTPAAARELALEPGKPVYALIKTAGCHLLGGGR